MAVNYDLKWKKDISTYIDTFSNFIFEGNIHDLQPIENDGSYEYLPLSKSISKMFCDDYCVVTYDHTRQPGKKIVEENCGTDNPDDGDDDDAPVPFDKKAFNSFTFESDDDPKNIEFFKSYYGEEYLTKVSEKTSNSMQGGMAIDIRRIADIISDFNEKSKDPDYEGMKPFMFILPEVSRYMTRPGSSDYKETVVLMMLFNAMQIVGSRCKLILMVDKMNDLPTWFESENNNSSVKKIFLPMPDADFRETFYRCEMSQIMDPVDDPKDFKGKLTKYSSYTERYSVRRLQQLRSFIENESTKEGNGYMKDIGAIDRTIFKFDIGYRVDPWKNPNLRLSIKNLRENIEKDLKGQSEAIDAVSVSLRSAVTGINSTKKNDRRPKAVFFFAGPTGTGKTELAKQITEQIFKKQDNMIRFDMSEFREDHTDARLFGAPPGYVGYEAGGELTRAVKQNPFTIILFDEIEKASNKIWDKFLQILGDGRLTDGKGETVSFTQSIIIFTSNLGITPLYDPSAQATSDMKEAILDRMRVAVSEIENGSGDRRANIRLLLDLEKQLADYTGLNCGFRKHDLFEKYSNDLGLEKYGDDLGYSPDQAFNDFVSDYVKNRVRIHFDKIGRREVMGRIGDSNLIVFNFITENIAVSIAENEIRKFTKALRENNDSHLQLTVTDEAKKLILDEIKKPSVLDLGGRGIVTCVTKMMSEPLGEFLFEHEQPDLKAVMVEDFGRLRVSLQ